MNERLVFKAARINGIMTIILAPVFFYIFSAVNNLDLGGPLIFVFMIIFGTWSLAAELIVFEADSIQYKLAMIGKRTVIKYADITSIDSSGTKKLIINTAGEKFILKLNTVSQADRGKVLSELKSRSGK